MEVHFLGRELFVSVPDEFYRSFLANILHPVVHTSKHSDQRPKELTPFFSSANHSSSSYEEPYVWNRFNTIAATSPATTGNHHCLQPDDVCTQLHLRIYDITCSILNFQLHR
ncbi:hypothetical protein J6590_069885 [Homalodisca vitripennis]|nr:hypothetical protein J6590_069885 [Homalodisca vitripennis]